MFCCIICTRLAGEKIAIGGFALKTLKKEKGLKFGRPSLSIELTKAIGRGPTELSKYPGKSFVLKSLGFISSMSFNDQKRSRITLRIMKSSIKMFFSRCILRRGNSSPQQLLDLSTVKWIYELVYR